MQKMHSLHITSHLCFLLEADVALCRVTSAPANCLSYQSIMGWTAIQSLWRRASVKHEKISCTHGRRPRLACLTSCSTFVLHRQGSHPRRLTGSAFAWQLHLRLCRAAPARHRVACRVKIQDMFWVFFSKNKDT